MTEQEKMLFVCGQCGARRPLADVVIVSEDEFVGLVRREDLARPAIARRIHDCGFIAIRCKEHVGAERLATQAVKRHLLKVKSSGEYC